MGMSLLPVLVVLLCVVACVPDAGRSAKGPAAAPPSPPRTVEKAVPRKQPGDVMHRVQWPGESLSIIAKWYTGKTANWKSLAEYNGLTDPNRIRIGDPVRIPESWLRTREPMPRAFVEQEAPEAGKIPDHSTPSPPPPDDTPELFGPKPFQKD
jgi:hypothetical protein